MIDYEKLKELHERCLKNRIYYFVLEFGVKDRPVFILCEGGEEIEEFASQQELEEKITELTKPEPKYKIGDVYTLVGDEITKCTIQSIGRALPYRYWMADKNGYSVSRIESEIFRTRQELIEHQISYWQAMLPSAPLPFNDGGKGYLPSFEGEIKGFGYDGRKITPDVQSKQSHVDADRCQHESDGRIYTSYPPQNKCVKCGGFYR